MLHLAALVWNPPGTCSCHRHFTLQEKKSDQRHEIWTNVVESVPAASCSWLFKLFLNKNQQEV